MANLSVFTEQPETEVPVTPTTPARGRKKKTLSGDLTVAPKQVLSTLDNDTAESVVILTQFCDTEYLKELARQIKDRAQNHQQNVVQRMQIEEAIALQERLGTQKAIALGKEKADRKFQFKELLKLKETAEDWANNEFSAVVQHYGSLGLPDKQLIQQVKHVAANLYLDIDFKITSDRKVVDVEYEFTQESAIESCQKRLALLGVSNQELKEFLASVDITAETLKKLEITL